MDFREQVVHLGRGRAHLDFRIQQTSGSNHLLYDLPRMLGFVIGRRCRNENHLWCDSFPFFKFHGSIIQRRWQAEPVLNEGFLPGPVALVHGTDLGNGHVGLVHHQQGVGWQVIKQCRRRLTGAATGEIAGVVLDAVAVAQLQHHFDVIPGALFQALGLHQAVVVPQLLQPLIQLHLDMLNRIQHRLPGRHIVGFRIDSYPGHTAKNLAGQRVEIAEILYLVIEQFDANRFFLGFRREDINYIAPNPVIGPVELDIVPGVLELGQAPENEPLVNLISPVQMQHHLQVGLGIAQAVDGRNRCHDDRIRSFQQRLGGRQAHLFDVLVNGSVFLDKRVGRGHIGFWLVVVVVGNEILHRIVGKELLELTIELGGQRLVMGHDDGRPLDLLDHIGDGEGLAGAGNPQQRLVCQTGVNPIHQPLDCLGLIACWLER